MFDFRKLFRDLLPNALWDVIKYIISGAGVAFVLTVAQWIWTTIPPNIWVTGTLFLVGVGLWFLKEHVVFPQTNPALTDNDHGDTVSHQKDIQVSANLECLGEDNVFVSLDGRGVLRESPPRNARYRAIVIRFQNNPQPPTPYKKVEELTTELTYYDNGDRESPREMFRTTDVCWLGSSESVISVDHTVRYLVVASRVLPEQGDGYEPGWTVFQNNYGEFKETRALDMGRYLKHCLLTVKVFDAKDPTIGGMYEFELDFENDGDLGQVLHLSEENRAVRKRNRIQRCRDLISEVQEHLKRMHEGSSDYRQAVIAWDRRAGDYLLDTFGHRTYNRYLSSFTRQKTQDERDLIALAEARCQWLEQFITEAEGSGV